MLFVSVSFHCPWWGDPALGARRSASHGAPCACSWLVARHARALIRRRASAGTPWGALHHGMLPGPHAKGCPCLPSPPSPGSSAGAPRGALGRCRPSPGPQSVVLLVGRRTVAKRQEAPLAAALPHRSDTLGPCLESPYAIACSGLSAQGEESALPAGPDPADRCKRGYPAAPKGSEGRLTRSAGAGPEPGMIEPARIRAAGEPGRVEGAARPRAGGRTSAYAATAAAAAWRRLGSVRARGRPQQPTRRGPWKDDAAACGCPAYVTSSRDGRDLPRFPRP